MKRFRVDATTNANVKFFGEMEFNDIFEAISWVSERYTYYKIQEVM